MKIDLDSYKKTITDELRKVENELNTVGRKNPNNPKDWEATPAVMETEHSDENEVADTIEEFEDHAAILKQLEIRYNELGAALQRIEKGTFGICSVGGEEIEVARLNANPAATTCIKHIK